MTITSIVKARRLRSFVTIIISRRLTVGDVGKFLSVSEPTVTRWIKEIMRELRRIEADLSGAGGARKAAS